VPPQAPGRTPHSDSRRASGTTQPQAPLRCPGAEDPASRAAYMRASGTTKGGPPGPAAREGGRQGRVRE